MNKSFGFGSLLVGLGLIVGCGEPMATPVTDPSMDTPEYEQQMTGGEDATGEAGIVEESVEVTEEVAPFEPAAETTEPDAAEAPAVEATPETEAPAPEASAPAPEEAPTATDAP